MKFKIRYILSFVCLCMFVVLSYYIVRDMNMEFDIDVYNFINSNLFSNSSTVIFKCITFLGGYVFLILTSFILYIMNSDKKYKLLIVVNLILSFVINTLLKYSFMRDRPSDNMLVYESGYSFPSGHSMISMCFYGYLIYLICSSNMKKSIKTFLSIFLSLIILLIGISRIYLGVHFASDVLGGFLFGMFYLISFVYFSEKYYVKK